MNQAARRITQKDVAKLVVTDRRAPEDFPRPKRLIWAKQTFGKRTVVAAERLIEKLVSIPSAALVCPLHRPQIRPERFVADRALDSG